jgi:hypothetical protein
MRLFAPVGPGGNSLVKLALGRSVLAVVTALFVLLSPSLYACSSEDSKGLGLGDHITVSSNLDGGYRKTQFFSPHYNTALLQWDSRIEIWLPPFRDKFSWGPYLHIAGIKGTQNDAWQNAWLTSLSTEFLAIPGTGQPGWQALWPPAALC